MKKQRTDKYYERIYRLLLPAMRLIGRIAYGIKPKPKRYDEPILVLSNHTTNLDFTVVASYIDDHMYYVCSRHLLAKKPLRMFLELCANPITVHKGSFKPSEVMDIIRRVRRGKSILLFCEGRLSHNGRTLSIDPATAKLAKKLGCKLVTFRMGGGFFLQPRWQEYANKGKLFYAGIVNEYDKEYVKNASVDELLQHIRDDLYVDAYVEQEKYRQPFKLKHGLRDIVRYYDTCPSCRGIDRLKAEGNTVSCSCGYSMSADEYGYFHGEPQLVSTIQDWEKLQLETYYSNFESGSFFSDEDVLLCQLDDNFARTSLASGLLESCAEGLKIGDYEFSFDKMEKMEILNGGSSLVFGIDNVHYFLIKEGACLNKYLELYLWAEEKRIYGKPG